jgi:hypothetical protein
MPVCISSNPMAWYLIRSSGIFKPKGMIGNASNCLMLFLSIMSRVVTMRMVLAICCALVVVVVLLFALVVGAGADVAELAGAGAVEPSELVGDALVELVVTDTVAVLVTAAAGEDTTLAGFSGLTGLVGFVGFVTLFTHVLEFVVQAPGQIGEPYGSGHVEVCDCVMDPV